MRFKLVRNFLIVVPVYINGKGPFDFELDTGAEYTLVGSALARELQITEADRIGLMTVRGARGVSRAKVRSFSLGSKTVENLPVLCTGLHGIQSMGSEIRGVVGMNFLSQFGHLINYRAQGIELEDGTELEDRIHGERIPIEANGRRIVLSGEVDSFGKKNLRLVLDSGAEGLVFYKAESEDLGFNLVRSKHVWWDLIGATSKGQQWTLWGLVQSLSIGNVRLSNLPAYVLANPAVVQGIQADGSLPANLFRSVYINVQAAFVVLNPVISR
ncbi:MAG TPA: retroviral-like aspartic protease family protein [Nitrospirales bacterium]